MIHSMGNDGRILSSGLPVSAVIVNYNAGPILTECIRTVLPQVSEIVVVDNDSQDESVVECLRQFADDPQIRIIRNNKNLGFAVACNIGFAEATSPLVLFLNPDCLLEVGAIAELSQVLQAEAMSGMVGGLLVDLDGTEQRGGRRAVPTPWRSFVRAFGLNRFANRWPKLFIDFHMHKEPLPDRPIVVEAISGACMLVKRDAISAVGLWDEGYFLHCEDLDWCMRFRQLGWKILFVPSARVTHVQGVCSRQRPIKVEWHKHRGMLRFYRKFFRHQYPGVLMGIVALGVWISFGMRVGYHLGHGALRWKGWRYGE